MYTIKRVSTIPATAMRISVDAPPPDGEDGGFQQGGVFNFAPAGEDGDTHQVGEHAARAIMLDPTLADHFECTPKLKKVPKDEQPPVPGEPLPAEAAADEEHTSGHKSAKDAAGGGKGQTGKKKR